MLENKHGLQRDNGLHGNEPKRTNDRALSSPWLRTTAEAIEKRLKQTETLREERSFLTEQAGNWSAVPEEDRNRINESYSLMKEDFHQRMATADSLRAEKPSELEVSAIQKYESLVQGIKAFENSNLSFAAKMSSQNKLISSFIKEFRADFAPQGQAAVWHPDKKTSFDSKRDKIWAECGFKTWNDYLYMKAQGDDRAMELWSK